MENTPKRRRSRDSERMLILLDMLRERHDHPDANTCFISMQRIIPSIGQSTVYRHLAYLVEKGLITEIQLGSGPARYDAAMEIHGHFHCLRCGKVWDISPIQIQAKYPGIVQSSLHIAKGICEECLTK